MSLPSWLSWMGPLDWLAAALVIVLVVQIVVGVWRLRVIEWPDLDSITTENPLEINGLDEKTGQKRPVDHRGDEVCDEPPAAPPWERR